MAKARALLCELVSDAPTDAVTSAGYDGDFALESHGTVGASIVT